MQFLLQRLKEPSTYAGLGILLSAFGIVVPAELLGYGVQIVTGAAGVAAILLAEKK